MKKLSKTLLYLVTTLVFASNCSTVYAAIAGQVQFVNGVVQRVTEAGKKHIIQKGDAVNEGDTLTTAPTASVQIKMQDGGFIAVRPDTSLKIDSFVFNGQQDGTESSFFTLLKGGFRAITGLIGQINKPSYRINTATATLGIRGTDHETFVVTPGSLLAATEPIGTYNKVNLGETTLTTSKGTISVLPNQMGFAGAADQLPKLQPLNRNIFTVAAVPASRAKGSIKEDGIRDYAVVDYALQAEDYLLGNKLPVDANFILFPIAVTATITTLNVQGFPSTTFKAISF